MSTELLIPQIGMGMTEGKIIQWHSADGDSVQQGALLYSIETDKSVIEIDSPASGVLRILSDVDKIYEVGTLIGRID